MSNKVWLCAAEQDGESACCFRQVSWLLKEPERFVCPLASVYTFCLINYLLCAFLFTNLLKLLPVFVLLLSVPLQDIRGPEFVSLCRAWHNIWLHNCSLVFPLTYPRYVSCVCSIQNIFCVWIILMQALQLRLLKATSLIVICWDLVESLDFVLCAVCCLSLQLEAHYPACSWDDLLDQQLGLKRERESKLFHLETVPLATSNSRVIYRCGAKCAVYADKPKCELLVFLLLRGWFPAAINLCFYSSHMGRRVTFATLKSGLPALTSFQGEQGCIWACVPDHLTCVCLPFLSWLLRPVSRQWSEPCMCLFLFPYFAQ